MGPYYRGTSQATGAFFDAFYQHPVLILLLALATIAAAFYVWKR